MNLRPFQIVLIVVFAVLALGGIVAISIFKGGSSQDSQQFGDSVIIWGTFDRSVFDQLLADVSSQQKGFNVVQYEEKDPRTFEAELINAIAEGRSPDLIIIPHMLLVKHRAKLYPLSFDALPERTFRDTYIDGAEIFLRPDGVYGLPFAVDPLVMYWNRDIFSSSGLAAPPKTWEELVTITTPAITKKNLDLDILRSAVAFGEYSNITHAKDILSMLFFQSGTDIVNETGGRYEITLGSSGGTNQLPAATAALSFYTQFAIPSSNTYSWNRALPQDRSQFLSGDLGLYFGMGSEFSGIQNQNPNLNFDIASVPQGAGATVLRDYGTFYAFAVPKGAHNIQGAFQAAYVLDSQSVSAQIAANLRMAPVYRAEIARGSSNPYQQVLYRSALITRGWLDPDPTASENVFKQMIEDVTSGRDRASSVVSDTTQRLRLLFK